MYKEKCHRKCNWENIRYFKYVLYIVLSNKYKRFAFVFDIKKKELIKCK